MPLWLKTNGWLFFVGIQTAIGCPSPYHNFHTHFGGSQSHDSHLFLSALEKIFPHKEASAKEQLPHVFIKNAETIVVESDMGVYHFLFVPKSRSGYYRNPPLVMDSQSGKLSATVYVDPLHTDDTIYSTLRADPLANRYLHPPADSKMWTPLDPQITALTFLVPNKQPLAKGVVLMPRGMKTSTMGYYARALSAIHKLHILYVYQDAFRLEKDAALFARMAEVSTIHHLDALTHFESNPDLMLVSQQMFLYNRDPFFELLNGKGAWLIIWDGGTYLNTQVLQDTWDWFRAISHPSVFVASALLPHPVGTYQAAEAFIRTNVRGNIIAPFLSPFSKTDLQQGVPEILPKVESLQLQAAIFQGFSTPVHLHNMRSPFPRDPTYHGKRPYRVIILANKNDFHTHLKSLEGKASTAEHHTAWFWDTDPSVRYLVTDRLDPSLVPPHLNGIRIFLPIDPWYVLTLGTHLAPYKGSLEIWDHTQNVSSVLKEHPDILSEAP